MFTDEELALIEYFINKSMPTMVAESKFTQFESKNTLYNIKIGIREAESLLEKVRKL